MKVRQRARRVSKAKRSSPEVDARIERLAAVFEQWARMMPQFLRLSSASGVGFELTHPQFLLLGVLNTRGPTPLATLRKMIGCAQSSVSEMISRLERLGYIAKRPDPRDSRAVVVGTTARGRRVLRARKELLLDRHRSILEALRPEDQERFVQALETVVDLFMAAQGQKADGEDHA